MTSHPSNTMFSSASGQSTPYPTDRTVLQLFELQTELTPDRPAITYGARTLSYAGLDQAATNLASRLREHGVGAGDFIPLVMDGGIALPLAMIATMKIGAPFVPVDQGWPRERVRTLIDQLRPTVLLASGQVGQWGNLGPTALHVDADQQASTTVTDLGTPATVSDLIYGFFTSGSTGQPKCAVNCHLGLLNRFRYMTARFGDGHIVLQNSQHAFDSSIWQLLWPLTNGSQVILPERAGILDLVRTIDVIERHSVTMTDFVPSIFNTLVEMLTVDPRLASRLGSLRRLLIGGEEVSADAVHTLKGVLPSVRITNTYGPTEASIGSIFHEITAADGHTIPIGLPIDNTYAAILTDHDKLARTGEIGMIYLGGDCLGIGYLADPAKTALAFVPNPLPQIPGSRLYRTGDLGYQRDDGMFMFVGRSDQQVKLGGVRIELPEVESVLAAHPAVREAKVIVHGTDAARALMGFVVARAGVTPEALVEHAREHLPRSSVPRRIVLLDQLPLTPNGKADRRQLAQIARQLADAADQETLTSTEAAVKEVWLELLARDQVGVSESFFESGGDSLSAQRLALALERRLGARLTIHDIVGAPTIRGQASMIGASEKAAPSASDVAQALQRDVRLDPGIVPQAALSRVRPGPHRLLLTGATGFVGAHLLAELATRTSCTVHCLVRGASAAESRDRLIAALRLHSMPAETLMRNVIVVPGDLARPYLGLAPGDFADLAGSVDTVIHNGALVNLVLDYASHRAANVTGTTEILRFVALGAPKGLHYVSTLSVFPVDEQADGSWAAPIAGEHDAWDRAQPADGYGQSKWVAERIIALARTRGIPATVYRLGEVMPHTRTGAGNYRSVLHSLLRACARLGQRFATDAVTDWTPVDKVSEFIVSSATSRQDLPDYLHVLWPSGIRIDRLFDLLSAIVPLREVTYSQFFSDLARVVSQEGNRPLAGLLSVLPDPRDQVSSDPLECVFNDAATLFSSKVATGLAGTLGVSWSDVDDAMIRAYLPPSPPGRDRWLNDSAR